MLGKRIITKQLECIDLMINYLKKMRVGVFQGGIDGYPSLKHTIELWPGDWIHHLLKLNKKL